MVILGAFALDENGIRPYFEDFADGEEIRVAKIFYGRDKRPVVAQAFDPETGEGGEFCADKNFVDGRVKLDPWKTPGEITREIGEEFRPIRILKITDPV